MNQGQIKLSWEDPGTGEIRQPTLNLPIALGREFQQMPGEMGGSRVTRIVLDSLEVSRYHALIDRENGNLVITDQNSSNGTYVNGQRQTKANLASGDTLQLGPYQITLTFGASASTVVAPTSNSQIYFNPNTQIPDPSQPPPQPVASASGSFPPPVFQQSQVDVQDLHATGLRVDEVDYLTIGAGLGSFIWADLLRIFGVKREQIVALGVDAKPYGRYKQLCLNSQIPLHERLRSNSDSCPDNIWGWPSYAWREAWHDLTKGKIGNALGYLWQVFAEPTFAQTYTPRAGNVFDSIDREENRIGWGQMFRYGSARSIRHTTDGRYAVAYSSTTTAGRNHAFIVARYVYLATGYPAIKFLPDLQAYREKTKDFQSVVNAYENHDHVYEHLQKQGGTVLIRGRGIVASRIIQRIYQARQSNPNIRSINLMRSPKPEGNKYKNAQRFVEHHIEFQPFNWPKACWGGDLRVELEKSDPTKRKSLINDWGGTTTADRKDWRRIVNDGMKEGWYRIEFGEVQRVEKEADGVITYISEKHYKGETRIKADFIIDATGLDADVKASPLLNDLVTHYNLPLNNQNRLAVSNDFELEGMRTNRGRMFAAGAITLGGPYAAVDSFLGLQYTALRVVDRLASVRSPGLKRLNLFRSFGQWLKWVGNKPPC
ncbi:FHA domain-containing protein [Oscillatoria salina]|uniref:FHA domain-containing protein n=1 Tax=Oscillatoria salina TaxID=331517 RepID=UPI001CCCABBE|nr:FHA domain-containing protein [Oscillatoria salina]MBZ8179067.1 FHA domain-containing protein [Oscillatoria salina IIICB1]